MFALPQPSREDTNCVFKKAPTPPTHTTDVWIASRFNTLMTSLQVK